MVEPSHPVDADRDRWLIETALPAAVALIALALTIARHLGAPL
jgi:hypothetical protein